MIFFGQLASGMGTLKAGEKWTKFVVSLRVLRAQLAITIISSIICNPLKISIFQDCWWGGGGGCSNNSKVYLSSHSRLDR